MNNGKELFLTGGALLLGLLVVMGFNTMLTGGCEAAREDHLRHEDADNKQWKADQQRKEREADVERARREWNK